MNKRNPGRPNKTDLKDSKQAILHAARMLIEETGLERLTIREVARRAGVGTALVNYYFRNKQGLKEEVAIMAAREIQSQIQVILEPDAHPAENLYQGIFQFIMGLGQKPYVARLILDLILAGDQTVLARLVSDVALPNLSMLEQIMETEQGRQVFFGINVSLFAPALMGATIYPMVMAPLLLAITGLDLRRGDDLKRYADHTARLLVNGLQHYGGEWHE